MKVIVERSQWFRGQSADESKLRRGDGQMCCLGFAALAAGFTEGEILEVTSPAMAFRKHTVTTPPAFMSLVHFQDYEVCESEFVNTSVCRSMMYINDDTSILDADREAKLRAVGQSIGIEFEFVG